MYAVGVHTRRYGVLDKHVFVFSWIPPELLGKSFPVERNLQFFYETMDTVFPTWRKYLVSTRLYGIYRSMIRDHDGHATDE